MCEQRIDSRSASATSAATSPQHAGRRSRMHAWLIAHPWHPRVAPWLAYLALMAVTQLGRDHLAGWLLIPLYTLQCGVVAWLLWRWRRHIPELNWTFHWSALPVGLGVCAAWIALGHASVHLWPSLAGDAAAGDPEGFAKYFPADTYGRAAPVLIWTALGLRLLGMSIVVPMFEEVFNRSLLLRSLSHPRKTAIGVVNVLQDLPLVDDLFGETDIARRAGRHARVLGDQFEATPLGRLTVFGVIASTFVFIFVHAPSDYAGSAVCGVAYCLLVGYTNNSRRKLGLGPVIWAHAITNAALWAWVVATDDWLFMS
ncbi:MAG: CPBP family intramembrane metalloprotease [Phycisphaerae bacterium]|nr:CPBP family intramembrane metalloprotease [Phycisphaerae bacterium]